jgi:hypothetical protein
MNQSSFWDFGMAMFAHNALALWSRLVDGDRFAADVQRFSDLNISAIISAHSSTIGAEKIDEAF